MSYCPDEYPASATVQNVPDKSTDSKRKVSTSLDGQTVSALCRPEGPEILQLTAGTQGPSDTTTSTTSAPTASNLVEFSSPAVSASPPSRHLIGT